MGRHGPAAGGGTAGWVNGLRGRAQTVRPSRSGRGGALRRSTVVVCAGHGWEFSDPKRRAVAREVRPQGAELTKSLYPCCNLARTSSLICLPSAAFPANFAITAFITLPMSLIVTEPVSCTALSIIWVSSSLVSAFGR